MDAGAEIGFMLVVQRKCLQTLLSCDTLFLGGLTIAYRSQPERNRSEFGCVLNFIAELVDFENACRTFLCAGCQS